MSPSVRPSQVPSLPPPPRVRPPVPVRSVLPNGLRVLCIERRRLPVVDVLLVFPAGAASDSPGTAGLAHLAAELLDAGTTGRSQFEVAAAFDALGSRLDAAAGWDHTTLSLHALSERLPESLDLLADVALNATFPDDEFLRRRDERRAEILQELADPDSLADLAIARAIHGPHHVYGVAAAGTQATVTALERSSLLAYRVERHRPNHAFIVLAGDVGADQAVGLIERSLGDWQDGPLQVLEPPPAVAARPTTIHLIDRPGAPQSEIRIGAPGVARSSPDYFPLVVLNTVLGGAFTSRLNLRLREEGGYTYGAFSAFAFRAGPGPFVAGAAVFTEATARAIAETVEEIGRIRHEPVPPDELGRAKRYIVFGLPRGFETSGGIASRYADCELHGLGDAYWEDYSDRLDSVDSAEVLDAAQRTLHPESLQIVVVGDAARVRGPLEDLGIGPVTAMQPPE